MMSQTYDEAMFTAAAVDVLLAAVRQGRTEGLDDALTVAGRLGGRIGKESDTSLLGFGTLSGLVYGIVWHEASQRWGVHS